ncbi:Phage tail fiber protein [Pseudomonas chlororaphis subsp. aurantiaca]|nr:Phage tail fiber protein [Pseudomonas chlororaphis subsp. aurantiaca]
MIDANSQFFAILTNVGMAKQANADALGIPWKITDMGVGDANDTDPIPNAAQTRLINEWRRRPLNQLRVDPVNPAVIIAEQIIPADEGGHWIRELGLYDADGDLVAVANCAPSFKPVLSQGSGRTQVVRMNFIVSSTGNITLKIDPAVVLATREYVDQRIMEELYKLDSKQSVRVATTANIALAGLQSVDGVALVAGDRVLVKNQTVAKDNGLYVAAAGAWARAADADASSEVTSALIVSVEQGATLADTRWQLVTDGAIVIGSTALVFQNITQGFAPINSPALINPTANTPAQFNNTKALATTEFVQRALGSFAGGRGISGNETLTGADMGMRLELATGVTVTLPATSSVPNGAAVLISAGPTATTARVTVAAGDQLAMSNLAVTVPYTLSPGGDFIAIREANVWRCHFGSETLKFSPIFAGVLGGAGRQRMPNGMLMQWVPVAMPTTQGASTPFNWPIAFDNAVTAVSFAPDFGVSGYGYLTLSVVNRSKTGAQLLNSGMNVTISSVVATTIIAIGY